MAHFSAFVNIAMIDGELNIDEEEDINRFVNKLDITDEEYEEILKNPNKYSVIPQNTNNECLERLLALFKIVFQIQL